MPRCLLFRAACVFIPSVLVTMLTGFALPPVAACAADKPATVRKPVSAAKPGDLRTFRFTAIIKSNYGETPFKVGTKITGEFTYDLSAKDSKPEALHRGWYESPNNRIVFKYRSLTFKSSGRVWVSTSCCKGPVEGFFIGTRDIDMPKGWTLIDPPKDRPYNSRTFSVRLQNGPRQDVVRDDTIPTNLHLHQFRHKGLKVDFYDGVKHPGGVIRRRATVYAILEYLERVTNKQQVRETGR